MKIKICTYCKEEKYISEFYSSKLGKYGVSSRCKICRREWDKKRRSTDEYREYNRKFRRKYYWNNKEKCLAIDKKSILKCKERVGASRIKYREENREKLKINQKLWRKNNKEYNKVYSHLRKEKESGMTPFVFLNKYMPIIKKVFGWKCFNCGSKDIICLDHHIPLVKRGKLEIGNVVPLCKSCNCKKRSKWPEDFYTPEKLREVQNKLGMTLTESGIHFYA